MTQPAGLRRYGRLHPSTHANLGERIMASIKTKMKKTTTMEAEPGPPFPEQHQEQPGLESELEPQPRWRAPRYRAAG